MPVTAPENSASRPLGREEGDRRREGRLVVVRCPKIEPPAAGKSARLRRAWAESEGEIALHGPKTVDAKRGCCLSKNGGGEHSPRTDRGRAVLVGSRS